MNKCKFNFGRTVNKIKIIHHTFADVSMNSNPFSSAYALASSYSTVLLVPKSDLLPASAITISGLAYNGKYDFKIPRSLCLLKSE